MKENLPEMSFYPDANNRRTPVIGVKFRSLESLPQLRNCGICGGTAKLSPRVAEYPYRQSGVIVRFDMLPYYECESCGRDTIEPETARQMQMSISFILDTIRNRTKPASYEDVEKVVEDLSTRSLLSEPE